MCSVIPDCSMETVKNPEEKENELQTSKYENPRHFPVKNNTFPSNSVPIYTENVFEESEDYDYYPETTTIPDTFITASVAPQAQNPPVPHEDTRKELRETLETYDAEPLKENSLTVTTLKTDSRSSEKLLSQTDTIIRHTQVFPGGPTSSTSDNIRRPDDDRNLQNTISELSTVPKLKFISTTSPPENMRKREDHMENQTLGRHHQERNEHHVPSDNQRGECFNMKRF